MNAKEKIEELLEASEDGTITAAPVTGAGLHRRRANTFRFTVVAIHHSTSAALLNLHSSFLT